MADSPVVSNEAIVASRVEDRVAFVGKDDAVWPATFERLMEGVRPPGSPEIGVRDPRSRQAVGEACAVMREAVIV